MDLEEFTVGNISQNGIVLEWFICGSDGDEIPDTAVKCPVECRKQIEQETAQKIKKELHEMGISYLVADTYCWCIPIGELEDYWQKWGIK